MELIKYKENETTTLLLERYMDMLHDIECYYNLKSMILKMFDTNDEVLQIDINDLRKLITMSESTLLFKMSKLENLKEIKLKF